MNFAILGCGNIANKFAKTIIEMGENLIACGSRDINKALEFKAKYNIKRAYGSYEELSLDSEVDVVYIATPNNMHYENSMMCLKNGKHVLCEKPFTISDKEARELYDYANEHNLFIMEALWIEFLPAYKKINELIKNNTIGSLKEISVNYGFDTNPDRKRRKFESNLGGGALLDIGTYNLAFIEMILKSFPLDFKSNVKLNEYNTDSYSKTTFIYPNDIKAVSICAIGEDIAKEAYIKGDKGYIYLPDFQNAKEFKVVIGDKEEIYSYPFDINGFEYQIRETIRCINNKMTSSDIYLKETSIGLMKLLCDIRKDWNMKFDCEE